MVMPQTPQLVFTVLWGSVFLVLTLYAGYRLVGKRDPLFAVLLLGGAICYFAEPMVDVLGLLWHPTIGQWVAVDTFRACPLWGLFVYAICFGGLPYFMLVDFRRAGFTARRAWTWIGVFWVVDVLVEIPILGSGLYDYYGDPPMEVAGLPLYWLFMNIAGPLETAVILLLAGSYRDGALLRGRRILLVAALPVSLDVAGSSVVGWPVFSALHAQAGIGVKYLAALLTVGLGVATLAATISFAAARSRCGGVAGGRVVRAAADGDSGDAGRGDDGRGDGRGDDAGRGGDGRLAEV